MQKNNISFLLFVFCSLITFSLQAQSIPKPMSPPRMVNDFVGLFSAQESGLLEQKLRAYHDSTSTQIYVVVVSSFNGYDRAYFAYEIGETWGIGQKGKDNGAVLLIKPKRENERGEVFIATGYGLEGALPDAINKRIVDEVIMPYFRQDNYYQGVDAGIDQMIHYLSGEYAADKEDNSVSVWVIIFIIIIILIIIYRAPNNQDIDRRGGKSGRSGGDIFFPPSSSASRGGGGFGGFSGGSFGGGGGGHFGGGGAGGSW